LSRCRPGTNPANFRNILLKRKHCTLTLYVKAADFRLAIFLSADAALLRVAMQRDAAPKCKENTATGLPSMLLDLDGANASPDPRGEPKKNEPEGM
jgi:hypothetical protein